MPRTDYDFTSFYRPPAMDTGLCVPLAGVATIPADAEETIRKRRRTEAGKLEQIVLRAQRGGVWSDEARDLVAEIDHALRS